MARERMSGPEQVEVLRCLSQEAAASLLGITARSLRDHAGQVPRNADGSYDGPVLVRWYKNRGDQPTLDDEAYEELLVVAEQIQINIPESLAIAVFDWLKKFRASFGVGGTAAFVDTVLKEWEWFVEKDRARFAEPLPSREEYLRKAASEAATEYEALAAVEGLDDLAYAVRCNRCERLRKGRRWLKNVPDPKGFSVVQGTCPDCDAKYDRGRLGGTPQRDPI